MVGKLWASLEPEEETRRRAARRETQGHAAHLSSPCFLLWAQCRRQFRGGNRLSKRLRRHGRACPGIHALLLRTKQGVDAGIKPGHTDDGCAGTQMKPEHKIKVEKGSPSPCATGVKISWACIEPTARGRSEPVRGVRTIRRMDEVRPNPLFCGARPPGRVYTEQGLRLCTRDVRGGGRYEGELASWAGEQQALSRVIAWIVQQPVVQRAGWRHRAQIVLRHASVLMATHATPGARLPSRL